jgi:hypothetical protein
MLEMEAIPQSCILYVQIGLCIVSYKRSLLRVESSNLHPSNQYILVRVIPSCLYGPGVHVSLHVVNVTWIGLAPLAFIFHPLNQFWIVARLVCSFCEAMVGSLSMVSSVVSSAKVTMVNSGEVRGLQ